MNSNLAELVQDKAALPSKTPILDRIKAPEDLRVLSKDDLKQLCDELRYDLVQAVSEVGGHFASSLGVVELTVALHTVFNTPHDRIVWDVGHQAYIHKILTERREAIRRVRQFGGISGFPKRSESEYDTFGVAHAGTSISAATGMLEACFHDYPGSESRFVVAVIGDGALTAGMAFEALNHAGQLHKKLIVILNDNEMSIAPNVGALNWAFSKAITSGFTNTARKHFKSLHDKGYIPHTFYRVIDKAEEAAQGFFSTPAMLFSSFGFRYIGPVDGHNLEQVIDALERAKTQDGPVLIHAITEKGKGYAPAEADPVKYHGVTPFRPDSGSFVANGKPKAPSYTEIFGKTLVEICKSDPRVVGITAAMPDGTGLTYLQNELPDRYYDVGIAEQHAVTFAAGLACEGMRPVCAIYSTFLQRAYDQVVHDVCIQSLPVIFAMDRGGLVGADGPTHHGVFDIGYLRLLPNMTVMAPKDEVELRDMLYTAVQHTTGPIAFRYPRANGLGLDISQPPKLIEIGKGQITVQPQGKKSELLLIGYGLTVGLAEKAAAELAGKYDIPVTVINARFVKPLDQELFREELSKHSLAISIEDHAVQGGFGSALLEFMADEGLSSTCRLVRLGIEDFFVEHGSQAELYKLCNFDAAAILDRALSELRIEKQACEKALSGIL
ncbi:1-deoxy-D-xylulose-5-phosphate synthase [bacterium]|nr:1-deoxy-D-xylulose-5-phosphate synthase [bacterium]